MGCCNEKEWTLISFSEDTIWASIEFAWLLKLCTFAQFDIVNFSSFRSFILNCIYLHWSVTVLNALEWTEPLKMLIFVTLPFTHLLSNHMFTQTLFTLKSIIHFCACGLTVYVNSISLVFIWITKVVKQIEVCVGFDNFVTGRDHEEHIGRSLGQT